MLTDGRYADPECHGSTNAEDFIILRKSGELLREVAFLVYLQGGSAVVGHATPETVTWECPCGRRPDLLSSAATFVTGGVRVQCQCGRGYFCGPGSWSVARNGVWEDGASPATGETTAAQSDGV